MTDRAQIHRADGLVLSNMYTTILRDIQPSRCAAAMDAAVFAFQDGEFLGAGSDIIEFTAGGVTDHAEFVNCPVGSHTKLCLPRMCCDKRVSGAVENMSYSSGNCSR